MKGSGERQDRIGEKANLYSMAKGPGEIYRDFSASVQQTHRQLRDWRLGKRTRPTDTGRIETDAPSFSGVRGMHSGASEPAETEERAAVVAKPQTQPQSEERAPEGGGDSSEAESSPDRPRSQAAGFPVEEKKAPSSATDAPEPVPEWFRPPASPSTDPLLSGGGASVTQANDSLAVSRWFVLSGFFDLKDKAPSLFPSGREEQEEEQGMVPSLAIFSLAGGVGKTALTATLGRALAAYAERVLLVETASLGLLPLYFGSRGFRQDALRIFSPPSGSPDAPVQILNLDPDEYPKALDDDSSMLVGSQDEFLRRLQRSARRSNRLLVDIKTASKKTALRMMPIASAFLVPLLPDMNSVASLEEVESIFATAKHTGERTPEPFYLLNQFDSSLPLHLDVRQILERQLGDRFLPFVVRRSPAVSEALAAGMTVIDYDPDSPLAADYRRLAGWVRSVPAEVPASSRQSQIRWQEHRAP